MELNKRIRMRTSNKMVREWLLENGYDEIWFKAHTNKSDLVFTQKGNYLATDLWNMFDGMCFYNGYLYFLDMKTNNWANKDDIKRFKLLHNGIRVLSFNVSNKLKDCKVQLKNGKTTSTFKVFVRKFE